jgi:hypothetical protein
VPPNLEARSHHAMYTFGNHIWVFNVEKHLTTFDIAIITTFDQKCISRPND